MSYPGWKVYRDKVAIPFFSKHDLLYCFVCGADDDTLVLHHLKPRGLGGSDSRNTLENLAALCYVHHTACHAARLTERQKRDLGIVLARVAELILAEK